MYLRVIKKQIARIELKDINALQLAVLLNIGNAKIATHELRTRGNYLGSNVSHIIKNLIENGYLLRERSSNDHREVEIWASDKGRSLGKRFAKLRGRFIADHLNTRSDDDDICRAIWVLRQLEQFWIDQRLGD
jgi:DNA-binding MarR family transcriptional regulator